MRPFWAGETWHDAAEIELNNLREDWILALVLEVSQESSRRHVRLNLLNSVLVPVGLRQVIDGGRIDGEKTSCCAVFC